MNDIDSNEQKNMPAKMMKFEKQKTKIRICSNLMRYSIRIHV